MIRSVAELAGLAAEWHRRLPARLREVYQPEPGHLVLELDALGAPPYLTFVCVPPGPAAHLAAARQVNPRTPLPFQNLLRHHLAGARVLQAATSETDRIVHLVCEGPMGSYKIIAELLPRRGNVALVSGQGTILGSLVPAGPGGRLTPGHIYEPPPKPPVVPGREPPPPVAPGDGATSLNQAAAAAFLAARQAYLLARRKAQVEAALRRAVKRLTRLKANLNGDLAASAGADTVAHQADLLKYNLSGITKGAVAAEVTDWVEGGALVRVEIDPALSPRENMERLYKRARRQRAQHAAAAARLAEVETQFQGLNRWLEAPELDVEGAARALGIRNEGEIPGSLQGGAPAAAGRGQAGRKAQGAAKQPWWTYELPSGHQVLVGKGAAGNDELTLRVARPHDWWFHVKGFPGAHVVLRLQRGEEPGQELLAQAAALALKHSKAPAGGAEIAAAPRKQVRKPRRAAAGTVTITNERSIWAGERELRLIEALRAREAKEDV